MTSPSILAALDTFQRAANRGTAVYLSPELVQELRDALEAGPEGEGPAAAYIDPEGEDADRQLLEVFYSQLGRGLEVHPETLLRGIRGVRAYRFTSCSSHLSPAEVQRIVEALDFCIGDSDCRANSSNHNRLRQRLKRLIATLPAPSGSGTACPTTPPSTEAPAEALAARPLLEQVAAMADCIGAQTVGQFTAISNRAAAWLRENPPGRPVAIEPKGCPTPGACLCVEPAPPAPKPGEVEPPHPTFLDAIRLAQGCHDYSGGHSGQQGEAFQDGVGTVVAVLKKAAVGPWDSQTLAVFGVGSAPQAGEGEA